MGMRDATAGCCSKAVSSASCTRDWTHERDWLRRRLYQNPDSFMLSRKPEERFFNGVQAASFQGGAGEDGGRPAGSGALQVVEYHFQFLAVGCGALAVVAVILGNYQNYPPVP